MATLHFRNARIFLAPTSAAVATVITEARSFDLNFDGAELEDDSTLGDEWKTHIPGTKSWSVSVESNYNTAQTTVFDAATQLLGPVRFYAYPDFASSSRFYTGLVWVKFRISGGITQVGRVDIDMTGDGALETA